MCICKLITDHLQTLFIQPEKKDDPLSASAEELPDGVPEVRRKTFCPPSHQRGEGLPSAKLRETIGVSTTRRGSKMDAAFMILQLFLYFFTLPVLAMIAKFTNAKATEVVNKVKCTGKNGKVFYKVVFLAHSHTYHHIHHVHTCTYICHIISYALFTHACTHIIGGQGACTWQFQGASHQRLETSGCRGVVGMDRYHLPYGHAWARPCKSPLVSCGWIARRNNKQLHAQESLQCHYCKLVFCSSWISFRMGKNIVD